MGQSIYQKADAMHHLAERIAELAEELPMTSAQRAYIRQATSAIAAQAIHIKFSD